MFIPLLITGDYKTYYFFLYFCWFEDVLSKISIPRDGLVLQSRRADINFRDKKDSTILHRLGGQYSMGIFVNMDVDVNVTLNWNSVSRLN